RPAQRPQRPPQAAPGWLVDRVRFEPLDPAVPLSAVGVGDYRGALEVGRAPTGVSVVNDVAFEDYVRGISEVPSAWPLEALKAQAVAARTYALHELSDQAATPARAAGAEICATDACQVYTGLAKERAEGGANWAAAVSQTAGQVLLYRNQPIVAKYSASNGGASAPGGQPYLRAVADPDDTYSPLHRWRVALPLPDVGAALAVPGPIVSLARTGDTITVTWQVPDGEPPGQTAIAAPDFSARLNTTLSPPAGVPRPVPSLRFAVGIDPATNTAVLDGAGWGHGIGLSQWGAFGKALRGMKAADILAAYYAGLRPVAVPADRLPARIKVAVDLGSPAADVIAATGGFRGLDQGGHPLATVATGAWHVVPEGTRLRVVPPADQQDAPTVQVLGMDTAAAPAPVAVRLRLSAPALVHVAVQDATGAPQGPGVDAPVPAPGDATVPVPTPGPAGQYLLVVTADAGGGRTATATLAFDVAPPETAATPPKAAPRPALAAASMPAPRPSAPSRPLAAGAGALLLAVLVALLLAVLAGARRAGRRI